jgi:hypothetical protein
MFGLFVKDRSVCILGFYIGLHLTVVMHSAELPDIGNNIDTPSVLVRSYLLGKTCGSQRCGNTLQMHLACAVTLTAG